MKEIKIYCWTWCPFCIRAKQLLDAKGVAYQEVVIDGDQQALNELKKQTGSGSVPQIFVDGRYVGGCDEIHQLDASGGFEAVFI
jgi:glutaredoxin 3